MLTKRQRQVLSIVARSARRGASPSVRDIAETLGLSSPATAYGHLTALVRKGYLEQTGRSRRYRLVKGPGVPVAGVIQAGEPIERDDEDLGELAIDPSAFTVRGELVALHVRGDSMVGAGILDGDYVVVKRQPRVDNGEIAAVLVNGGGTLKRVRTGRGKVKLEPANARFAPITLKRGDNVRIYGKLVAVLRGGMRVR